MSTYYFTLGLTYVIIGFAVAMIYVYVFRKKFLGNVWGGILVGIVGSFIGGFIDHFFKNIIYMLTHLFGSINLFTPIITAILLLWIFNRISNSPEEY